jgi:hypothetical protein
MKIANAHQYAPNIQKYALGNLPFIGDTDWQVLNHRTLIRTDIYTHKSFKYQISYILQNDMFMKNELQFSVELLYIRNEIYTTKLGNLFANIQTIIENDGEGSEQFFSLMDWRIEETKKELDVLISQYYGENKI